MRRFALVSVVSGLLACLLVAPAARGDDIEVRDVALRSVEDGMALDADFEFELTPRLAEVVATGVPLYFSVEFELTRRRWYWFDDTAASRSIHLRLSYHALSRQYRLSTGPLQQSFPTLEEALNVLKRVRNWLVVDRAVRMAGNRPAGVSTDRIPLPPPPATAFTTRGYPMRAASATMTESGASAGNDSSVPGTTGTPAAMAACRAAVLLPILVMASGDGPTNVSPASTHACAKSSFSARNP